MRFKAVWRIRHAGIHAVGVHVVAFVNELFIERSVVVLSVVLEFIFLSQPVTPTTQLLIVIK